MKAFTTLLSTLLICISIQNCSSVKVLDSWKKNNDVSKIKENSFFVVARTDNQQARIAFENEIVKQIL